MNPVHHTKGNNPQVRDRIFRAACEVSGGLGDLGVFLPLALALVLSGHYPPRPLFLAAGLFYVGSALFFRLPMPVQPLKAMAAIALVAGVPYDTMRVAGLEFSLILLFFLIPGVLSFIKTIFTPPVVRGIQLGVGLFLVQAGISLGMKNPHLFLLGGLILLLAFFARRWIPPLIPLIAGGVVVALASPSGIPASDSASLLWPGGFSLSPDALLSAFVLLVVPQAGLTLGNAIVATEQTARDLFGERAKRATMRNITASIAGGNFLSALLGGIPMCHGSGGMTAHYSFGARTEKATVFTGVLFLFLALFLQGKPLEVLLSFPEPFLGVTLVVAGAAHGFLARKELASFRSGAVVLTTALLSFFTHNITAGALGGIVLSRLLPLLTPEKGGGE